MIDLREIRETIDDIKRSGTTIGQAEKLALLYLAADYMEREEECEKHAQTAQNYAYASPPKANDKIPMRVVTRGTSEFLAACDGVPVDAVLDILDEHMEAIRVLYPKEYEAILRRLDDNRI